MKREQKQKGEERPGPEQENLSARIGKMLRNSPPLHTVEHETGFNIVENTFSQRMIHGDVLQQGVRIEAKNYFQGLAFVDYFVKVIEESPVLCERLVTFSKAMKDAGFPPDEFGDSSYLPLGGVVIETLLTAKEHGALHYVDQRAKIAKAYESESAVDVADPTLRPSDPYFDALGLMVIENISEAHRPLLVNVSRRNDIRAIIFTEQALTYTKELAARTAAEEALANNQYLTASLIALDAARAEITFEDLEKLLRGDA